MIKQSFNPLGILFSPVQQPLNLLTHLIGRAAIKKWRIPTFKGKMVPFGEHLAGKVMQRQAGGVAREAIKSGFEGRPISEVGLAGLGAWFPGFSTVTGMAHEVGAHLKRVTPWASKHKTLESYGDFVYPKIKLLRVKGTKVLAAARKLSRIPLVGYSGSGAFAGLGYGEFIGDNNTMEDRLHSATKGALVGMAGGVATKWLSKKIYQKGFHALKAAKGAEGFAKHVMAGKAWAHSPSIRVDPVTLKSYPGGVVGKDSRGRSIGKEGLILVRRAARTESKADKPILSFLGSIATKKAPNLKSIEPLGLRAAQIGEAKAPEARSVMSLGSKVLSGAGLVGVGGLIGHTIKRSKRRD